MKTLKDKSTRKKKSPVIMYDILIPRKIYETNSNIALCIDVVYIIRVVFMVSIDRKVKYRSIIQITSQNEEAYFK